MVNGWSIGANRWPVIKHTAAMSPTSRLAVVAVLGMLALGACGEAEPALSDVATPVATATPTATPTPVVTATPTPTLAPTPTPTLTATPTAVPPSALFTWPQWARTARIAGSAFHLEDSLEDIDDALDRLAAQHVSVVLGDSPWGVVLHGVDEGR